MKRPPVSPILLDAAYWATLSFFIIALFGVSLPPVGTWLNLVDITLMGTAISGLIRLAHRRVFRGDASDRSEAVFLAVASLAGALIWWALDLLIFGVFFQSGISANWVRRSFLTNIIFDGMPILVWSFLRLALRLVLRDQDEAVRLSRASALAHGAQQQMLRDQLNPHFLFNALNSILALIDEDQDKARQMASDLEEFLRYALAEGRFEHVPFEREWEATRLYFVIQKTRYEDRLEVRYDVDPDCLPCPIPGFLLHPLVENAVKFGMGTSPMPLRIRIEARLEGDRFLLKVANTGRWLSADTAPVDGPEGTKTGLKNLRMRLDNSFPGRHEFSIAEEGGWVEARLAIPTQEKTRP